MTSNEALQVLVELLMAVQRRGALTLQEASVAWDAIQTFQIDNREEDTLVSDNQGLSSPRDASDEDSSVD